MPGSTPTCIIALDLDNFYVGCERLRDPTLVGRCVGIKQKGILATCSYEARAKGVGKLMSVNEAKRLCPELVLVSGEDLTLYRSYSRKVFDLARILCGPLVEKLGMDELFLDVSALVQSHMATLRGASARRDEGNSLVWFRLAEREDAGFWYREMTWAGQVLEGGDEMDDRDGPLDLQVASHLASYLRGRLLSEIGLTSSAGISPNKTLSKLIASLNKPADQTSIPITLVPNVPPSPSVACRLHSLLDPYDIRSIPGFGSVIVQKLSAARWKSSADELDRSRPITVLDVRSHFSLKTLRALLPSQSGHADHLWSLLHGLDASPVKASPAFPSQIGVEDSYARDSRMDWPRFSDEVERLSSSLLMRVELELMETETESGRRRWLRYPQKLGLSIRSAWDSPAGRISTSTSLPGWTLDAETSIHERVARLFGGRKDRAAVRGGGGLLGSLMRELVKGNSFDIYVINVFVCSLSLTPPNPTLDVFQAPSLRSPSARPPKSAPRGALPTLPLDLDVAVLAQLPSDLREEVLGFYGITEGALQDALRSRATSKKRPGSEPGGSTNVDPSKRAKTVFRDPEVVVLDDDENSDKDGVSPLEEDEVAEGVPDEVLQQWEEDDETFSALGDDVETCLECGIEVVSFAQAAHALFHELGT